jgi:hypothetical protein
VTQKVDEGHDTEVSLLPGSMVVAAVQAVPLKVSACPASPTAAQNAPVQDTAVNLFTGSILTKDVVQTAPLKVRAESRSKATQYVVVGQEISATLVWELPIVVGPDQLVPLKMKDR